MAQPPNPKRRSLPLPDWRSGLPEDLLESIGQRLALGIFFCLHGLACTVSRRSRPELARLPRLHGRWQGAHARRDLGELHPGDVLVHAGGAWTHNAPVACDGVPDEDEDVLEAAPGRTRASWTAPGVPVPGEIWTRRHRVGELRPQPHRVRAGGALLRGRRAAR